MFATVGGKVGRGACLALLLSQSSMVSQENSSSSSYGAPGAFAWGASAASAGGVAFSRHPLTDTGFNGAPAAAGGDSRAPLPSAPLPSSSLPSSSGLAEASGEHEMDVDGAPALALEASAASAGPAASAGRRRQRKQTATGEGSGEQKTDVVTYHDAEEGSGEQTASVDDDKSGLIWSQKY